MTRARFPEGPRVHIIAEDDRPPADLDPDEKAGMLKGLQEFRARPRFLGRGPSRQAPSDPLTASKMALPPRHVVRIAPIAETQIDAALLWWQKRCQS